MLLLASFSLWQIGRFKPKNLGRKCLWAKVRNTHQYMFFTFNSLTWPLCLRQWRHLWTTHKGKLQFYQDVPTCNIPSKCKHSIWQLLPYFITGENFFLKWIRYGNWFQSNACFYYTDCKEVKNSKKFASTEDLTTSFTMGIGSAAIFKCLKLEK